MATALAPELHARAFARFYSPLALTSVLLTGTNLLMAAALARSDEPAAALAGYSVAFAFTGLLYSALLVVQQSTAAKVVEGAPFKDVHRFALVMGALLSTLEAIVAFTPVGHFVFSEVIAMDPDAHREAVRAVRFLWVVPFLTAFRASHQGVLVAMHRTRSIAWATALRTLVLVLVAFGVVLLTGAGAWAGGLAFSAGLVAESVVVGASSRRHWPTSPKDAPEDEGVLRFSAPLMTSAVLWWAMPLIINAALARTPEGTEALAAFAALEAIAWLVTAPVGQLQHASIALVSDRSRHRRIRSWARSLAFAMAALLLLFSLPPVRSIVLRDLLGLEPQLASAVGRALPLTAAYPLLYAMRGYYFGLFVRAGCPGVVARAAVGRTLALIALAVAGVPLLGHTGVLLGAGLTVVAIGVEGGYLEWRAIRDHRRLFC
jgi:hypothetical protein